MEVTDDKDRKKKITEDVEARMEKHPCPEPYVSQDIPHGKPKKRRRRRDKATEGVTPPTHSAAPASTFSVGGKQFTVSKIGAVGELTPREVSTILHKFFYSIGEGALLGDVSPLTPITDFREEDQSQARRIPLRPDPFFEYCNRAIIQRKIYGSAHAAAQVMSSENINVDDMALLSSNDGCIEEPIIDKAKFDFFWQASISQNLI